jgi:hypothetical protein
MAKITLPYTLANGNTADGGQVQQNFDAVLTQVNGNLDANNIASSGVGTTQIADGAVTLAKLASGIPLLDDIAYANVSSAISFAANTETNVINLSVSASVDEFLIVLFEMNVSTNNTSDALVRSRIYVDSTLQYEWLHHTVDFTTACMSFYVGNVSAGSHSVEGKIYAGDSGVVSALQTPYAYMMALTFATRS